ncbi:TonB-dependent siderophore receptor [Pseudomonas tructae]|uniref:Metal-pseudopaline receptor CntO n=1 Tax=Pseudomonas tructae TaxID=2518644 RepID=A0A411MID9_9PSED|nr:TonB-dependent siderophore receptor [Pseudomonas tructae]QBF26593.1 TonB-dependent siderophore receptor [Pseudomonas tructae]
MPQPRNRARFKPLFLAVQLACALPLGIAVQAHAEQQAVQYNIAPGALGDVLSQFAAQAGIDLAVEGRLVSGLHSNGLRGSYGVEEGLRHLLTGSGYSYAQTAAGFVLVPQAEQGAALQLDATSIQGVLASQNPNGPVDGYLATRASSATKTDTALLETTQSISVVTRDRLTAQGAQTVSDGLGYTAGVHAGVAGNNPTDNTIMVRGFQQINANAYTDGLRNNQIGYYAPEPWGMERIEVLKGPASVLYGQGSPGGTVNFVSKRPTFAAHREVGFSTGSDNRLQTYTDVGDVLDQHNTLAYRLVALGRDADNSIDGIKDDRVYVAPSLTWAPDEDTSLTILASYQRNKNLFTSNMPYSLFDGSNPNGRVPRHRSLNEPGFDAEKSEQTSLGYEFSHALNDTWTLRQNARYTHFTGYEHQLYRNSAVIAGTTLNRYYQLRDYGNDNFAVDNQLLGKFDTGPLNHTLLGGVDYQHSRRSNDVQTGDAPAINIYSPDRSVVIDTSRYTSLLGTSEKSRQLGVYLQDQIKLGKWVASLGGRYDWASQDTDSRTYSVASGRTTGGLTTLDADDFTGRLGLGYLFDSGVFPYISYSESFIPTSGTDRSGSPFEPETARQYEVGVKYQPSGYDSYLTVAAFDLRRQNVLTTDVSAPSYSVQEGEVTSRGIEVEAVLKPASGLNVIASWSLNDVEVSQDNPNAAGMSNKGKTPARTPKHLASLWSDYTVQGGLFAGLGFGAGVRYTGSTFGDAQNTFKVPDYTVMDAMLSYDFGKADASLDGLKAQLNVKNLTDKYYIAGCFASVGCLLGAERTVTADLTYKW